MALNGDIVGHIVVAKGGRRLKTSTKNDIVLSPAFISLNARAWQWGGGDLCRAE